MSAAPEPGRPAEARDADFVADMLIVGGGFAGMIMALKALECGFDDVLILEKADDFGGTWRENTYPGVACDVPAHLYSIAEHPKPDWTRRYAGGSEIWDYMREVARRERLYARARFGRTVSGADWDGEAGRWRVTTAEGETFFCRVLVSGTGPLHVPAVPAIPGLDGFPGRAFHSAEWDHGANLAGQDVAVVGTGASAVQIVPELARSARRLTIYQRSAPWVVPRFDAAIPRLAQWLFANVPGLRRVNRGVIFTLHELQHAVFRRNRAAVALVERIARKQMEKAISDPALRRRLTPDYQIGCKRILLSSDWYPALARENVEVVAGGIAEVRGNVVIGADGVERRADALIFATGFNVIGSTAGLPYRGRGARSIGDSWTAGEGAWLGTAVHGFPNLFFLLGPNTALGHNSVLLMIEAQADHVLRVVTEMRARGIASVEPRAEVQAAYVEGIARRLDRMVWQTGGCTSWYKDADGRIPTLWPGTVREFMRAARRSGLGDYAPAGT